jgi:HK97 gp10 family phage protein
MVLPGGGLMGVEISGATVLLSDLEKMVPMSTDLDQALTAGAKVIADEMRTLAPTGKTGRLKAGVGVGPPKNGSRGRVITVGIHRADFDSEEYYPAYVEYGHGGPHPAAPHPYARPAYDIKKDEAWNAVKSATIAQLQKKGL